LHLQCFLLMRQVHVQPEVTVCKEGDDKPDKQRQWYHHCNKEALYFVTKVHEYRNDITCFEQCKQKEKSNHQCFRHIVAEEHTNDYLYDSYNQQYPEYFPYPANLLFTFRRLYICMMRHNA